MTRREHLRAGVLAVFAMVLGKYDSVSAAPGQLTCDLNQWGSIRFKYGKEVIDVPVKDIFAAIKAGQA